MTTENITTGNITTGSTNTERLSGSIELSGHQYGKAENRVVRIYRDTPRHEIHDINVSTCLRGDFADAYLTGDQSKVLPTDTQKQTAYSYAKEKGLISIETYGLELARHFVDDIEPVSGARIEIEEYAWERAIVDGSEHDYTWIRKGQEVRTASITIADTGTWVIGGLKDLVILKSTGSEFSGFLEDPYTVLEPTDDRVMATTLVAQWRFVTTDVDWESVYAGIKAQIVKQFAQVHSLALQQTLFHIGKAILEEFPIIAEVRLSATQQASFRICTRPLRSGERQRGVPRCGSSVRPDPSCGQPIRRTRRGTVVDHLRRLVVVTESALGATLVVAGAHVVTMDGDRSEYSDGYVVISGNKIVDVGAGTPPEYPGAQVIDGSGCLITPGLVNTHHHLYQWITRGLAADSTLFEWLTTLYPVWAGIDADAVHVAATGGLTWLAKTGCTTTTDHHYVVPRDAGDVFEAEITAAAQVGLRFHPCRGSMDLGQSSGGLPPDHVVEKLDDILTGTQSVIDRWHDPNPGSMLQIAVAPCSPFSVTEALLRESATLARENGVRMHTHLAETLDEERFCHEHFGCTPVEYMERVGWVGPDVWYAHAVHLDDAGIETMARTGTAAAHCPTSNARLGAGIARAADLVNGGVTVGLGVDGAASNEACSLIEESRHALLFARAKGGPQTMTVRKALELGTIGGARVLGREGEIGSIEVGKLADLAVWKLDTVAHAGITDPVAALVLGSTPPLKLLLVNGANRSCRRTSHHRRRGRRGLGCRTRTPRSTRKGLRSRWTCTASTKFWCRGPAPNSPVRHPASGSSVAAPGCTRNRSRT